MARGYGDRTGSDYRPENNDRWREDERERSSWRSGRPGTSEREDERGFFERAGDELRSWFSDDDDRRSGRDYERGRSGGWNRDQDFDRGNSPRSSWDRDVDRDRERGYGRIGRGGTDYSREDRSSFGGMAQGGLGRSGSGFGRDRDRRYGPSRGRGSWGGTSDRDRSSIGSSQSWNRDRDDRDRPGVVMYEEFSETLGGFGNQRFGSSQDDHYRTWRDRQLSQLDQDYDDYCREREQQFHQDFDSWRRNRPDQGQARTSSASSGDIGISSNAGVGTTTASLSGTSGGSAVRSSTSPSPAASDTTGSTEEAGAGTSGSRSGSKSRS